MKQNIEDVISRGEKLDDLQDKTHNLEQESKLFRNSARTLKRHFCFQNAKMIAIIACIIIVIILIIIATIYGSANTVKN